MLSVVAAVILTPRSWKKNKQQAAMIQYFPTTPARSDASGPQNDRSQIDACVHLSYLHIICTAFLCPAACELFNC